jgi:RNA polymerase sigma-70 factor (ECF subfamily)
MSNAIDITRQLQSAQSGDADALGTLLPLVYDELRRIARRQLEQEAPGHTLQPTALVHEAYLRLIGQHSVDWQDRSYFFSLAASMMRRVLVNHARDRRALKRGDGALRVTLSELDEHPEDNLDLIGLNDALDALAVLDPRQAKVVELKFFGGLEAAEIAPLLKVSEGTVRRDWTLARMWLGREMSADAR